MKSTRSCRPSEAHTLRCHSNGSKPCAGVRLNALACRRRSARSTKSRVISEGLTRFSGVREVRGVRGVREVQDELAHEFAVAARKVKYRPVTIVDAGRKKELKLVIDVPVEDMARLTTADPSTSSRSPRASSRADDIPSGPASAGEMRPSIWSAIHPRLLELIRAHRSTLIFVNSRRLAERLAGALNELAGETLVRSHHGSLALPQRVEVEDLLKAGALRALVATSSLELGIDMGAIDLVVQIEAPPTVASGLQRIGRGGHQANAISEGVIFPKFQGRPSGVRGRVEGDARRRRRSDSLSEKPARYRRAADRGDDVDGRVECRQSVRNHSKRCAVRGTESIGLRGCARHAVGPLSVG